MAGKRIGDHQVGIYKKLRTKLGQEVAAAKAGISVRSARRLDSTEVLPTQREARTWRTRTDPFDAVWQSELVPMLEAAPALTAMTLFGRCQSSCRLNIFVHAAILCAKSSFLCSSLMC